MKNKLLSLLTIFAIAFAACACTDKTEDPGAGGETVEAVLENIDTGEVELSPKDEFLMRADTIRAEEDEFYKKDLPQVELNLGSGEIRDKWNELLNDVFAYLEANLDENEFLTLNVEQTGWLEERAEAVEAAGAEFEGGSMQPLVENSTEAGYTRDRVYELIDLIGE